MPKEDLRPEAILEALKKVDIVSELFDEKNKNNLKMIAEGKVSGGKQIGPYARLLTYLPGEVIMNQGEWGGNTFYFSLDNELEVYIADEAGKKRKADRARQRKTRRAAAGLNRFSSSFRSPPHGRKEVPRTGRKTSCPRWSVARS